MNSENKDEVVYLYLDDIIPNRFQPREVFDERALKELAVSIKEHGVIQPIIVRSVANSKYEIIAGERRYKASALAGLTKIPAIIRNLDDKESSKVALLENLQRRNLNPIEEARTYQKILELDQMTQEDLAKTMGKSQSAVANKLRLLSLPIEIQDALLQEKISERHARTLLSITDSKKQQELLNKVINERMTVRELEDEIKKLEPNGIKDAVPMNNQSMEIPDSKLTASTKDFLNKSPLAPTNELPADMSNYGKITVAPPIEDQNAPQYINYGEIPEDEDDDETNNYLNPSENSIKNIDINDMKSNTNDINPVTKENPQTSLDNLLNIPNINFEQKEETPKENETQEFKFITPAEEIVKNDSKQAPSIEDYFKSPDIIPTNNFNNSVEDKIVDNTVTIKDKQSAIEAIRKTVHNIENNNIKIEIDEMDFDKSYQIIIKIEK